MAKKNANAKKQEQVEAVGTLEDGTVVKYTLRGGQVIEAQVVNGKVCCPTCARPLPKPKGLTEVQKAREAARIAELKKRLFEEQQRILAMLQRSAGRLGEELPEIEAILAEGEQLASEG